MKLFPPAERGRRCAGAAVPRLLRLLHRLPAGAGRRGPHRDVQGLRLHALGRAHAPARP